MTYPPARLDGHPETRVNERLVRKKNLRRNRGTKRATEVVVERKQAFGAFPMSMREFLDANGKSIFVGANTTRRVYDEQWLANLGDTEIVDASNFENIPPRLWRPFGLSDGCKWTFFSLRRDPNEHRWRFSGPETHRGYALRACGG